MVDLLALSDEPLPREEVSVAMAGYLTRLRQGCRDAHLAIEQAYQMLEVYGVPRQRARSLRNGIGVLMTRMERQEQALNATLHAMHEALRNRDITSDHAGLDCYIYRCKCGGGWTAGMPERHMEDCLAKPAHVYPALEPFTP